MSDLGTPRALRPLAEQVLAWVAQERRTISSLFDGDDAGYRDKMSDLRRIELCAQAVIEIDMFMSLYTGPRISQ